MEPQLEPTGAGSGTWEDETNTTHTPQAAEQAVKTPQTPSRIGRGTWAGCACRVPFVIRTKAVPTLPDYLGAFESLGRTPRRRDREDARLRISGQWAQHFAKDKKSLFQLLHPEGIPRARRNGPTKHGHRGLRVFSRLVLLVCDLHSTHQVAGALRNSSPS